jgi:hypothetical protein
MRRLVVCLLLLAGSAADAQESVYVGLGLGSFDYEEKFVDPILGTVSDSVNSYKLIGGFELSQHFAIEVSYGKTDDILQTGSADVPPFGIISSRLSIEYTKTAVRLLGQWPLDPVVLLGGLGYFSGEGDFQEYLAADCCGTATNEGSISDDGTLAMLGIEWRFGRFGTRYGLRLEYEWWDISGVDASTVGFAVTYGF